MATSAARAHDVSGRNHARARADTAHGTRAGTAAVWLDRGLETVWLTAAAFIPLIVLSENVFVNFTDLPKVTGLRILASLAAAVLLGHLVLKAAVTAPAAAAERGRRGPGGLFRWFTAEPRRLIILAGLSVVLAAAMSAAFSIRPAVSVWGKDPGRDGHGLYTTAAYFVIFLAIALRLRTAAQAWRLWAAVSLAGLAAALIGISQHWGLDPLSIGGTGGARVTGPSANAVFFGALLVGTMPIAAALSLAWAARRGVSPLWFLATVAAAYSFLLAAAFSGTRGAWLATLVAAGTFALLSWWVGGRKTALSLAAAGATAAVLVIVTVRFTGLEAANPQRGANLAPPSAAGSGLDAAPNTEVNALEGARINRQQISSGLSVRMSIWRGALTAFTQTPQVDGGRNMPGPVRSFLGYGPDTFRMVFLATSPNRYLIEQERVSAAHNEFLNRLAEVGAFGLLAYMALLGAAIWLGMRAISMAKGAGVYAAAALSAGLVAAIIGRMAEQMFGIPQAGDTLILWLGFGMLAAAPFALALRPAGQPVRATSLVLAHRAAARSRMVLAGASVTAVAAASLLGYLVWSKNIVYLQANALAEHGVTTFRSDPQQSLKDLRRAAELAPDVPLYPSIEALVLRALAERAPDAAVAQKAYEAAYAADIRALRMNPLDMEANFSAAFGAYQVALHGDPERILDAILIYERLAKLAPSHSWVPTRLAKLYEMVKIVPATGG